MPKQIVQALARMRLSMKLGFLCFLKVLQSTRNPYTKRFPHSSSHPCWCSTYKPKRFTKNKRTRRCCLFPQECGTGRVDDFAAWQSPTSVITLTNKFLLSKHIHSMLVKMRTPCVGARMRLRLQSGFLFC